MMNGNGDKIYWLVIAALFVICFASCSSYQDKLTNTSWQVVSMQSDTKFDFNHDGVANTDVFKENIPCKLDDIFILKPMKLLILDENEDVCYNPKQRKGKWSVNERSLMLHPKGRPTTWFEIISLDKDELRTIYHHYDGGHYKVAVVFKAVPNIELIKDSE